MLKEPIEALGSKHIAFFFSSGSRNSDRNTRHCTRAHECHDVATEKGLAGGYDRTSPGRGLGHKAKNTREYVLLIFWQDCVADRLGCREGNPPNTLAPPKSMFSHVMTGIDMVEEWNEERMVGSGSVACMWIYTKAVLCDGH